MKLEINDWFGHSIMIFRIDEFEDINKDIKKFIIDNVTPSDDPFAKTTDRDMGKEIADNVHNHEKFAKLFEQIQFGIDVFLKNHKYNNDAFDVFITKSWVTLTEKDQYITPHKHTASHYSLVYYVDAEKGHGDLTFKKPESSGLFVPNSSDYFDEQIRANIDTITYGSRTGDLIIFPSYLMHNTSPNELETPRISVSLDFLLTMKEGIISEHNLPNPNTWKKLKI